MAEALAEIVKMETRITRCGNMKSGITTGTCAAAAAAAAMHYVLTGEIFREVKVSLPGGGFLFVPVFKENGNAFYCIKDAGDDPDVTDKAKVKASVVLPTFSNHPDGKETDSNQYDISGDPDLSLKKYFYDERYPWLYITGGTGVGIVTKSGLEQDIGYPAINKVPRDMIFSSAFKELCSYSADDFTRDIPPCIERGLGFDSCTESMQCLDHDVKDNSQCLPSESASEFVVTHGFLIIISVENGEEIAKKTFNPRLGIEGGISILGTTGIVEPMSEKAIVKSIEAEMRVALAEGDGNLFAAPGNYGERYIRENHIIESPIILCSNYIGDTIDLAVHLNAQSLTIAGNCGKLCKLAAGIMNTHSKIADGRFEVFAANAALSGASQDCIKELKSCITTDEMLSILTNFGLREKVVDNMMAAIKEHVTYRAGALPTHVIMYSEKYGLLGKY